MLSNGASTLLPPKPPCASVNWARLSAADLVSLLVLLVFAAGYVGSEGLCKSVRNNSLNPFGPGMSNLASVRVAIGRRLREARVRLGESQPKFAERLGVAKLALLKYETGGRCPGADQLCLLSSTGVDANYVAFGVPSLATHEARRQFAAVLARLRDECSERSVHLDEAALVEAAWLEFSSLVPAGEASWLA